MRTQNDWLVHRPKNNRNNIDYVIISKRKFADAVIAKIMCNFISDGDSLANARLIAAAPTMLQLLKDIKATIEKSESWWMDCPDRGGFDLEAIDKAIAEAESEDVCTHTTEQR